MKDILNKIKKIPAVNLTAYLLIFILVISMIPLYAIAPFTHPAGDDYTYGAYTAATYNETGSVLKTAGQGVKASTERWENWQGTHTAIFIMTMVPSVFGYDLYPAGAIILITVFILSSFLFIGSLTVNILKLDKIWSVLFTVPFLILGIQFMPSIVEGFFWFNGAWYYTFFFCLAFIWAYMIINIKKSELKGIKFGFNIFIVLFLSFFIGGGSFPVALPASIISVCVLAWDIKRKKNITISACICGILLASFLLSVLAPGNAARAVYNEGMPAVKAVVFAMYYAGKFILETLKGLKLVILLGLLPLFFKAAQLISKRTGLKFKYPVIAVSIAFCLFASMFAPALYAMGNTGPGRIQDIYHYCSCLLIMFSAVYLCGWTYNKYSFEFKAKERITAVLAAAVVFFAVCGFSDFYALNSARALNQIVSGEAQDHEREMNDRQRILQDPSVRDVVLEPLKNKPSVIFLWDIKADPELWRNKDMAKYYDKESIKLSYDDGGY